MVRRRESNEDQQNSAPLPGADWSDAVKNSVLPPAQQTKLNRGEVVVEVKEVGTEKLVAGRILLNGPADKIWPILANPFEFSHGIYPRMHKVDVITDEKEHTLMRCTIGVGAFFPDIVALVDTKYVPAERIDFHKVGGSLKDLSGGWTLTPRAGGKTEVSYWMHIDPGIPVPGWVVRKGVEKELPNTLKAVRSRLEDIQAAKAKPVDGTVLAAEI